MTRFPAAMTIVSFGGMFLAAAFALAQPEPTTPTTTEDALFETLMAEGRVAFRACSTCHGSQGGGGEGPKLAGNSLLESTQFIIGQIVYGGSYMPPFGSLPDREIAAVATYVRNSFGNAYGVVTEADVSAFRSGVP